MPQMREVAEMAYLWYVLHLINGANIAVALPDFQPKSLEEAITDALGLNSEPQVNAVDFVPVRSILAGNAAGQGG